MTNCLPPLGILSIAAYLESKHFNVKVIDIHAERMSVESFRSLIRKYQPRYAGITVLSSMVVSAHSAAKIVKQESPDCIVVMGGVHAELYPEQTLQDKAVDLAVRGDGERPLSEIVAGTPWEKIDSVSFMKPDGTVHHTPMQTVETDLDRYPMPAYHLVDFKRYFPSATSYRNLPAINIIMTRGCPGRCAFCNSANTALRSKSPQSVFEQIQLLREQYGIKQVQFFDDTFTVNKKGVIELCRLLRENHIDITFSCYIRGDCFNNDIANALKSAGCHQVMVGIETGSERIMKNIRKPISKQRYAEAIRIAQANNIEVRGGFIIGSMGETWETMKESLQFAIDLDLDFLQLSISTPYPGTELFKQALEEGRLKHTEFRKYGQGEPIVQLDDLTESQILEFEKYAFRKFYIRPKMFLRQLRRVSNLRQLKDLYNAFMLLIVNKIMNPDPNWSEWENLHSDEQCSFYTINKENPDFKRLTFEVRKS